MPKSRFILSAACLLLAPAALLVSERALASSYPIVDTGQVLCYDAHVEIAAPAEGETWYGQDAQYSGNQPDFVTSADGLTVFDAVTGLTWQQSADTDLDGILEPNDKVSWAEAEAQPGILNAMSYGGYADWRLPTIKELYSLIDFRGIDPSGYEGDGSDLVPFIDTEYFDFIYGDEASGERLIDAQYWSATQYVGTVFDGQIAHFGVNLADGRIKGYPRDVGMNGVMTQFLLCVRGNEDYGVNAFVDNGDGTVTDEGTGLMWMQADSGEGMNWQAALGYAENLSFAGHDDWRLPNVKELQSIVDYTRSPSTDGSAAIDPVFQSSPITDEGGETNFPFYWSGTTHANWSIDSGRQGAYVAFGEGLGWMPTQPPGNYVLMDVHGAGCQRSDPKEGDPADWPYGHGPQGDVIRIYNYVRCVRDAEASTDSGELPSSPAAPRLSSYPNPFNPSTEIAFSLPGDGRAKLAVFDSSGRLLRLLADAWMEAGDHSSSWDGRDGAGRLLPSGIYLATLSAAGKRVSSKLILTK